MAVLCTACGLPERGDIVSPHTCVLWRSSVVLYAGHPGSHEAGTRGVGTAFRAIEQTPQSLRFHCTCYFPLVLPYSPPSGCVRWLCALRQARRLAPPCLKRRPPLHLPSSIPFSVPRACAIAPVHPSRRTCMLLCLLCKAPRGALHAPHAAGSNNALTAATAARRTGWSRRACGGGGGVGGCAVAG